MDYPELRERALPLLGDAWDLGVALVEPIAPANGSPLSLLSAMRSQMGTIAWTDEDIRFPVESVRGLVAIHIAQLDGFRSLIAGGPPLLLHPAMTLIRGAAEAGGLLTWLLEPWVAPPGDDELQDEAAWAQVSIPVLVRSQVLRLDEMANRRWRREVGAGAVQPQDETALSQFKQSLTQQHGSDKVTFTDGRKKWAVAGVALPNATERVTSVTEYAYGNTFRGSGINPYPMLSGYAHARVETLFKSAPASGPVSMSSLLEAELNEAFWITSLALRLFAVTYELAARALGADLQAFQTWEVRAESLVLTQSPRGP